MGRFNLGGREVAWGGGGNKTPPKVLA